MSDDTYAAKPYSNKIGSFEIRRWYLQIQDVLANENWEVPRAEYPLRKIVVAAAVRNPFAGRFEADLSVVIDQSHLLGREFSRQLVEALAGRDAESYGKAAIVGQAGEYEHGNAFLTATFATPIRQALGEARAWVPSIGKRGTTGAAIDIPLAHKADMTSEAHLDSITASFDDAPAADEVVVLFAVATGGPICARIDSPKAAE